MEALLEPEMGCALGGDYRQPGGAPRGRPPKGIEDSKSEIVKMVAFERYFYAN